MGPAAPTARREQAETTSVPGVAEPAAPVDHLTAAAALASRIAERPGQDPVVAARAAALAERIAANRYHLVVLGEFKRGKSTLVNALAGHEVLPTGVVPLTTVATEVHFGRPSATTVVLSDGTRVGVASEELAAYVTEAENPSNRRGVDHAEVGVELRDGATWAVPRLVVVDTPGLGSVHEHQTAAARQALATADGVIVVLSVDSPVSEGEQALLAEIGERRSRVFVVVNKADHLAPAELTEVRQFVVPQIQAALGNGVEPYFVSARSARSARRASDDSDDGLRAFREALGRFVHEDLAGARTAAALSELERLAGATAASSALELAAVDLGLSQLDIQARHFEAAVEEGRRRFTEDRLLLDHEVAELAGELTALFDDGAVQAAGPAWAAIAEAVAAVPLRRLDRALATLVPSVVEAGIEPLRRAGREHAESRWSELAKRFERRMQAPVEDLRARASELFEVHLPSVGATPVRDRGQFAYVVVTVEGPGTAAARFLSRMLPLGAVHRRALAQAERDVRQELIKHANRARYDLVQQLRTTELRFVGELAGELEETERSIRAAIERARTLLAEGHLDREARRRADDEVASLVRDVRGLVASAAPEGSPTGRGARDGS